MFYKEDLDKMECAMSHGAKKLWLHSKCHITAPTWVKYENGVLNIHCSWCSKIVAKIAVKSKND